MIRRRAPGLALACAGLSSAGLTCAALPGSAPLRADPPVAAESSNLAPLQTGLDYHSFANIEQFRVTRMELDLRLDFRQRVLSGVVGLQIKRLDPGATQLILDTRDITVLDVTQKAQEPLGALSKNETTWVSRPFRFDRKDPILGQALVIDLPPSKRSTEFIRVEYETSPDAAALHWLTAAQTRHGPFLYTKSDPIGARSWIPLQDTPQVRMTYKAVVHTDSDALALMSAKSVPDVPGRSIRHNGVYSFAMTDAVPASAVALGVGDFKFQQTGSRSGVFAYGGLLKAAAVEFAGTEGMIAAAEKLLGPYRWDRFDAAVMPAAFTVEEISQPCLAFVAPMAIAGDKSRVSIIARALARSWSGELVNNATWRDLWLNEAFSTYLASRIMSAVHADREDGFDRALGLIALRGDLARLKPEDQALAVDLRNRDPTARQGSVPAQKGRLFLTYLEAKFGRDHFDDFLRGYFEHFAFKSITTEQFERFLQEALLDRTPGIVTRTQALAWIDGPGLPADAVLPSTDVFDTVRVTQSAWVGGVPAKKLATRDWLSQQWIYFLETLPAPNAPSKLAELDRTFGFGRSPDAAIAGAWFLVVIRNQYQPGYVSLEQYLKDEGQGGLILPLYEALMQTPAGAVQAKRVYKLARPGYHPELAAVVDAIVKQPGDAEDSDE